MTINEIPLAVGTPVGKHTGYSFPGEIRAAFRNCAGELRYVVEATVAPYQGMLHIFSPQQLVVRQGGQIGAREQSEVDGNKPS